MPIIRKLVAQDENEENQWLKVDHSSRYIVNLTEDWQFLFGPNSELSNSNQIVKIAAKFDDNTFNNIKIAAYLYDQKNASIANADTCVFNLYKTSSSTWSDDYLTSINGSLLPNSYFFINPTLTTFTGLDFLGGDTIMIEATIIRLGVTYRDRIYVNHLGIFDNASRLRQDVEFLEITKKDL